MEQSEGFTQAKQLFENRQNQPQEIHRGEKNFTSLNTKQIERILQLDLKRSFEDELLDNPPLNKTFSPKVELGRIRKLPKYLKKETLEKFKVKLTKQERAWTNCYKDIKTLIYAHPDVSKLELVNLIKKYSKKYGFDKAQIAMTEGCIDDYLNHHLNVKK